MRQREADNGRYTSQVREYTCAQRVQGVHCNRERITEAEKQTMADIALRSESTCVRREFSEYIVQ